MNDLVLIAVRDILSKYSTQRGSTISLDEYGRIVPRGDWDFWAMSWLFPKTYLDGDLITRMSNVRGSRGILGSNNHEPSDLELGILLEAFRGKQYQGFLRHLMHSYCDEGKSPFPVRMPGTGTTCCICGKPIMHWKEWKDTCDANPGLGEMETKNYLAFGSSETSACMCLDCLVLLKSFKNLLDDLDPGILNYQKSTPGGLKA